MNERYAYYDRRDEAVANHREVMSCIIDGMAQNHTTCPYFANTVKNINIFISIFPPYSNTYSLVQSGSCLEPENPRCNRPWKRQVHDVSNISYCRW